MRSILFNSKGDGTAFGNELGNEFGNELGGTFDGGISLLVEDCTNKLSKIDLLTLDILDVFLGSLLVKSLFRFLLDCGGSLTTGNVAVFTSIRGGGSTTFLAGATGIITKMA
jgi:hypothetical protein